MANPAMTPISHFVDEIKKELKKQKWRRWLGVGIICGVLLGVLGALVYNHLVQHCLSDTSVVQNITIQLSKGRR